MRYSWQKMYIEIAKVVAKRSEDPHTKVGAVLVKDGRLIASGWNGQPHGFDNSCEIVNPDGSMTTKETVIHAEANVVYFCAKHGIKTDGTTLYITMSPCIKCGLAIIQAGIKKVYYRTAYRDPSGIAFLRQNNIKVEQLS